ncbi:ParA family protein [Pseudomonas sp. NFACC42-2]|jgi:cellulose biosynthesis protein BcsQ|uniref:ParA family protein n=1 Tax=Pseudomonas TaxID=286 RepID=UPI003530E2E6
MHLKSYDSEVNIMKVTAVVSTKAGPGKTTVGVNLGAFCADAGIRTLLIDLDNQPSLSSFYALSHEAPGGISRTTRPGPPRSFRTPAFLISH